MQHRHWIAVLGALVMLSPGIGALEGRAAAPPQHGFGARLPLEPTRTVELTTDAVTWMSLDVSPDGDTIVFATLGDLYLMPISGGRAQRISSGMAVETIPGANSFASPAGGTSPSQGRCGSLVSGVLGSSDSPMQPQPSTRSTTKTRRKVYCSPTV